MVQLPESILEGSDASSIGLKTIAALGEERIRRVIQKVESQQSHRLSTELPGISESSSHPDLGFRAFKLASSNIKPWDADFDTMEHDLVEAIDNIKSDRLDDDVLYELLLKYGLDLAIPTETRTIEGRNVTVIGAGALVVCLADDITLPVVAGIAALKDELGPERMRVVFKDAGFTDDVAKTNAAQILKQAGIDDVKSL